MQLKQLVLHIMEKSGSWGDVNAFSAHPLKNLNGCGDGGFITTDDKTAYEQIKRMRNHGLESRNKVKDFGYVSRMDNLQAAILNYRIKNLDHVINQRRINASIYYENLNPSFVDFRREEPSEFNTYHTFVIQCSKRNALKRYLLENGIETAIHYPIPIHKQEAYVKKFGPHSRALEKSEKQSAKILSLPIHQFLEKEDIALICNLVNNFYKKACIIWIDGNPGFNIGNFGFKQGLSIY